MMTTELCTYTRNACDIARRTGVERIELCAAPLEGGTTPSAGLIRYARSLRTMAAKKAEFPDLSPDALSDAYPGRCQSLTQVLSTADARLTALTTEREA